MPSCTPSPGCRLSLVAIRGHEVLRVFFSATSDQVPMAIRQDPRRLHPFSASTLHRDFLFVFLGGQRRESGSQTGMGHARRRVPRDRTVLSEGDDLPASHRRFGTDGLPPVARRSCVSSWPSPGDWRPSYASVKSGSTLFLLLCYCIWASSVFAFWLILLLLLCSRLYAPSQPCFDIPDYTRWRSAGELFVWPWRCCWLARQRWISQRS